jgi:hypothetical protein
LGPKSFSNAGHDSGVSSRISSDPDPDLEPDSDLAPDLEPDSDLAPDLAPDFFTALQK